MSCLDRSFGRAHVFSASISFSFGRCRGKSSANGRSSSVYDRLKPCDDGRPDEAAEHETYEGNQNAPHQHHRLIRMRSCTARHPWNCHRPTPVRHILSDLGPSSIARFKMGPQLRGRPGRQLRGRANRGCGGMRQEPEKRKTWLVPRGARPE